MGPLGACWARPAWGWNAIGIKEPAVVPALPSSLCCGGVGVVAAPRRSCASLLSGGVGGVGVARCRGLGQCALVAPALSWLAVLLLWWVAGRGGVVGGLVVNCIVDASIFDLCVAHLAALLCCGVVGACVLFVFMSVRWMPWHQGPMKDVVACDKPRGAG